MTRFGIPVFPEHRFAYTQWGETGSAFDVIRLNTEHRIRHHRRGYMWAHVTCRSENSLAGLLHLITRSLACLLCFERHLRGITASTPLLLFSQSYCVGTYRPCYSKCGCNVDSACRTASILAYWVTRRYKRPHYDSSRPARRTVAWLSVSHGNTLSGTRFFRPSIANIDSLIPFGA